MAGLLKKIHSWWLFQDYIVRGDEGEWLLAPPVWMRHVTPWRVLNFINAHTDVCWANVVMWKQLAREGSWWPSSMCFHPYDYCGKFDGKRVPQCAQGPLITIKEQDEPAEEAHAH